MWKLYLFGASLVFACVEIERIRELKRTCLNGLNRRWEYYIGDEADERHVYFYKERADGRTIRQARAV